MWATILGIELVHAPAEAVPLGHQNRDLRHQRLAFLGEIGQLGGQTLPGGQGRLQLGRHLRHVDAQLGIRGALQRQQFGEG